MYVATYDGTTAPLVQCSYARWVRVPPTVFMPNNIV
jgi:hypothetical protein